MRIAHLADIHWGLGYPGPDPSSRFDDICHVMYWTANKIIAEKCDLVLVAGDMFRKADISLEKGSREIIACTAWLRKLAAAGIDILIISGTPSHDPASAYELLKDYQLPRVTIITEPKSIQYGEDSPHDTVHLACLPGMDRSNFVARETYRGLPAHEVHQKMTEYLTEIAQVFSVENLSSPSILVGHFTYDLADTGFADVLMQQEAVLTQEAVSCYDLVCLGHIHRPQQNGAVFYSGSPERLSFNDEGIDTGFWIHEWNGQNFASHFIETPARQFITRNLADNEIAAFVNGNLDIDTTFGDITHAIVRIRYTCSEDLNKALNRRALEKTLYDAGAFFVSEIKGDIVRSDRVRDEAITEALGPVAAVRKWAANNEYDAVEIEEMAAMTAQLVGGDS